jgi:hypothetical protein
MYYNCLLSFLENVKFFHESIYTSTGRGIYVHRIHTVTRERQLVLVSEY